MRCDSIVLSDAWSRGPGAFRTLPWSLHTYPQHQPRERLLVKQVTLGDEKEQNLAQITVDHSHLNRGFQGRISHDNTKQGMLSPTDISPES